MQSQLNTIYSVPNQTSPFQSRSIQLLSPQVMNSRVLNTSYQQHQSPINLSTYQASNGVMLDSRQYQTNNPHSLSTQQASLVGQYSQYRSASTGRLPLQQPIVNNNLQLKAAEQMQSKICQLKGNQNFIPSTSSGHRAVTIEAGSYSRKNDQLIKQLKHDKNQKLSSVHEVNSSISSQKGFPQLSQPLHQSIIRVEPLSKATQSVSLSLNQSPKGLHEQNNLLLQLRQVKTNLNKSVDQYQLAFQQKRMNSIEMYDHKQQFKKKIQSSYQECQILQSKFPSILSEKPYSLNGEKSLNRAPLGIQSQYEINSIIDTIEATYYEYGRQPSLHIHRDLYPTEIQGINSYVSSVNFIPHLSSQFQEDNYLKQTYEQKISHSNSFSNSVNSPIKLIHYRADQGIYKSNDELITHAPQQINQFIQNDFFKQFIEKDYSQKNYERETQIASQNHKIAPLTHFVQDQQYQIKQDYRSQSHISIINYTPIADHYSFHSNSTQQIHPIASNVSENSSVKPYVFDRQIQKVVVSLNQDHALPSKQFGVSEYKPITDTGVKYLEVNLGQNKLPIAQKEDTYSQSNLLNQVEKVKKSSNNPQWKTGEQIEGVKKLESALRETKILTLPKNSAQLNQLMKDEKYEEVSEYAYHVLSDIDRKIIQVKSTIEQALTQSELPMTKELLIEIVDSLGKSVKSCDEEVSQKAIQKIHQNANKLLQDKTSSFSLYIYLQKIQDFLKERMNVVHQTHQAHELSLINYTDASITQNHQNGDNINKYEDQTPPPRVDLNVPFFIKNNTQTNYLSLQNEVQPPIIQTISPSKQDYDSYQYTTSNNNYNISSIDTFPRQTNPDNQFHQVHQQNVYTSQPNTIQMNSVQSYTFTNPGSDIKQFKQIAVQEYSDEENTKVYRHKPSDQHFDKQETAFVQNSFDKIKVIENVQMGQPGISSIQNIYSISQQGNFNSDLYSQKLNLQNAVKNTDLKEDPNYFSSYQYSSQRPPVKQRVTSYENQIDTLNLGEDQQSLQQIQQIQMPQQYQYDHNQEFQSTPQKHNISQGGLEQDHQTKLKFLDLAAEIKQKYPPNHRAHSMLISYIWDDASQLPESQWNQFIHNEFNENQ